MYEDLEALLRAPGRPNYAPDPYGNTLSMAPPPPRNGLGQQYDPQMDGRMQDYDLSGGDSGQSAYQPPPQPSPDPYAGMLGSGMASGASRLGMGAGRPSVRSGMPYQGATISPEANGSRPWDQFNTGLQPSPFKVTDNYMENGPVHTLGYSSRHGISQPTVDYSGMAQRAGIDRYNMDMSRMLGNQEIAREANKTDMMRTMMGVQQRSDAAKANAENRYMSILGKVPEGKRTPYIEEGLAAGHLDRTVSQDMLQNEMLARAKAAAKTGSGVDLRKFLGSLSTEFDHNKTSRSDLIQKLQQMGYTADQIDAYKNDPQVGRFAQSLLGPRENFETYGLSAIGYDAADRGKQLWSLISGR